MENNQDHSGDNGKEENEPDKKNEKDGRDEDKMDEVRITSTCGTEFEIHYYIPPHLLKYQIPHALPLYVFGPWGEMLFQKIHGVLGNAWDNRYFLKHPMTLEGWMNKPLTELHTNIRNYFESILNKKKVALNRAGEGGILHSPTVHNTAIFQGNTIYHNFDVHLHTEKMDRFANEHPLFCELLNKAKNRKPGTLPKILKVNGELTMLIHQLKNPACAPGFMPDYCSGKIEEFLMSALWQIDRKDPHRPFKITAAHIEKAEEVEEYMRAHLSEFINYSKLAREAGINLKYLKVAFKHRFAMTMDVYLRKLRMDTACILLLDNPGMSIPRIALEVGYNSYKDFTRVFEKIIGRLPRDYRKNPG